MRTPEQILIDSERLHVSLADKKRYGKVWTEYVGEKSPPTPRNVMRFAKALELTIRESIFGKAEV